jgi:hypothetical protein
MKKIIFLSLCLASVGIKANVPQQLSLLTARLNALRNALNAGNQPVIKPVIPPVPGAGPSLPKLWRISLEMPKGLEEELDNKVYVVLEAYENVRIEMHAVETVLNDFLESVKQRDEWESSAEFENLMQDYNDLTKRIMQFKSSLENNLSSIEGVGANERVEVYKFLKSIRKDFKYFVRDINKKINNSFGDLDSILFTYQGNENSAWAFVLKFILGEGPLNHLKPSTHKVKGGGSIQEARRRSFADEYKTIMKSWIPKL